MLRLTKLQLHLQYPYMPSYLTANSKENFNIIIIIIINMRIIVSFIQGSHTHIPETNHVPRGYIVTAILCLLFMVPLCLVPALVLLFFYVSTFRSMCAVPKMAVFCSSLTSWFPGMSLTYFLNDLEMVPVAPIITGITLVLLLFIKLPCFRTIIKCLQTWSTVSVVPTHA